MQIYLNPKPIQFTNNTKPGVYFMAFFQLSYDILQCIFASY